jgi:hypothetical protein
LKLTDRAEATAVDLRRELEAAKADVEQVVQGREAAQARADELLRELEAAQIAQGEAEADAAELRQADAEWQARGRWARLRAAWRGE